jgi:hypothetical protein
VSPPISFVYGNLVFGATLDDVWAAFSVPTSSYEWLSEEAKRARLLTLMGALEALEADIQILRVGRRWDLAGYLKELEGRARSHKPAEEAGGHGLKREDGGDREPVPCVCKQSSLRARAR